MAEQVTETAEVTATLAEAVYDTLESLARDFDRHRDMLRRRAQGETKADAMDRREANTWDVAANHMRSAVRDLREQVTVREWVPEDGDTRCQECGHAYQPWFTDNPLWNEVMGGNAGGGDPGGCLCPRCFADRAERVFPGIVWRVIPEQSPSTGGEGRG